MAAQRAFCLKRGIGKPKLTRAFTASQQCSDFKGGRHVHAPGQ